MNYEEALAKIGSFRRLGPKPGLSRIRKLLCALGNPQEGLNVIHAAGTNGKGTSCTLISSVLTEAGYRTGLYLSPHVSDFRERIQIDGKMISRDALASLADRVCPLAERMCASGDTLAEFEVITAIAFLWFAEKDCDVVVLETGMGGRFDATNVVQRPLVSLILSISLDHTQILGNTLEKIAYEKCGIIKKGCPVVCSPGEPPEALSVIRRTAEERGSPLIIADRKEMQVLSSDLAGTRLRARGRNLFLPFLGDHQIRNAAAVLSALEILRKKGWKITDEAAAAGFRKARLPARLEVMSRDPLVLIDGAHNPGGTAALGEALLKYLPGKKITAIMGMMADKDAVSSVRNLKGIFSKVIAVEPPSPRAMPAEKFAGIWRRAGISTEVSRDAVSAMKAEISLLGPGSALVLCGSLYLAGQLRGPAAAFLKSQGRSSR